ncbi:MAG: hypothetical protein IPJ41_08565 [Phycisphaerales bacterium]|nr:hypothetical protein [Phycisphaerales bacterium]
MSRRAHQPASHDRWLPAAVALLLIVSFMPARVLAPARWFGELQNMLVAPVAQPMRMVGGVLSPARPGADDPAVIAQLRLEVEHYKTLYEQMRERKDDLLRQMEQMQLMVSLNPSVSTRLLYAPVIGGTSDPAGALLEIRAGRAQGVNQNDVVAVEGVQLFGRVKSAGARTSWILPTTAKNSGRVRGKVMIADGQGLECALSPAGDGTLTGDVAYDSGEQASNSVIQPGQVVRLFDAEWPASAQMLVLGTVESVQPAPDSPLRPVIVVRPGVALERVTEVIVRVSSGEGESAGGAP